MYLSYFSPLVLCAFENESSNCLPVKMQSHSCISPLFKPIGFGINFGPCFRVSAALENVHRLLRSPLSYCLVRGKVLVFSMKILLHNCKWLLTELAQMMKTNKIHILRTTELQTFYADLLRPTLQLKQSLLHKSHKWNREVTCASFSNLTFLLIKVLCGSAPAAPQRGTIGGWTPTGSPLPSPPKPLPGWSRRHKGSPLER